MRSATVIVTTYNWPHALERVLASLCQQTRLDFEVIVADDGSRPDTAAVIKHFQQLGKIAIRHLWQEDKGFRAAKIRNKAALLATTPYLIFLDGDCIVPKHYVASHLKLAEQQWFVAGQRVLISESLTKEILKLGLTAESWSVLNWLRMRLKGKINRWIPLLPLPLGRLRKLGNHAWYGVKTCNLALWRDDFIAVNGFDENYEGWGYEDSDLVCRLLRLGIKRKSGRYALTVFHLWHPENARDQSEENYSRLEQTLVSTHIKAAKGINQYMELMHQQLSERDLAVL